MESLICKPARLLLFVTLSSCLAANGGLAQDSCNTYLGSIHDTNNNCAPCINHMEDFLDPVYQWHNQQDKLNQLNDFIKNEIAQKQERIDALLDRQDEIDHALVNMWPVKNLNGPPTYGADDDIEALEGHIERMRNFPFQDEVGEWFDFWIKKFESFIALYDELKQLDARAQALSQQLANGPLAILDNVSDDCCPESDTKYSPGQFSALDQFRDQLAQLYDDYYDYRSRLIDEMGGMLNVLEDKLAKRAKDEKEGIKRREAFRNGLTGFLKSKFKDEVSGWFKSGFVNAGYELDEEGEQAVNALANGITRAMESLSEEEQEALVFRSPAANQELIDEVLSEAFDDMPDNDRRALEAITGIIEMEMGKELLTEILGKKGPNFLKPKRMTGNFGFDLIDKLWATPFLLWEDLNLRIDQGAYDHILIGIVQCLRLSRDRGTTLPLGPLYDFLDALSTKKGRNDQDIKRALTICLPETTAPLNYTGDWKIAFLEATGFPHMDMFDRIDAVPEDRPEYMEFQYKAKIRFKVRFDCMCGVLEEKTSAPVTTAGPWENITLTGALMKPKVTAGKAGLPWWVWTLPPVFTGATFLLLDDDGATTPPLTVNADQITIPCDGSGMINVLENDTGDGLTVLTVSPVNSATVTLGSGGNITISDLTTTSSFSFNVTVGDDHGQSGTSTVTVNVTTPPISATDDVFETPFNTPISGNVIGNDQNVFSIVSNTEPNNGNVVIAPGGTFTFTPDEGFQGTSTFTYTVEGPCNLTAQATVTIMVEPPSCNFTATFETMPANCGVADGSATIFVEPPANYSYLWSNGITQALAEELTTGDYTVTVTDVNGCSRDFAVTVVEKPADYITGLSTVPGNCIGEGADILLTLETPGSGPMVIDAAGPGPKHLFIVEPGSVNLADYFTVIPGDWIIKVTDQGIDDRCAETIQVTVDDNTVFTTMDDFYETLCDQEFSGNVLDNDDGLDLEVISNTQPAAGTVEMQADGSFTYTPPTGQTGQFSFQYTVMDACGNEETRNVIIQVNPKDCLFDATFETTPANCGIPNGSITTTVVPDGSYSWQWSNSSTTKDLLDIPAGEYSITVTSQELNCNKEYQVTVDEIPNNYATNVITTPGTCLGGGDISFTLMTPGGGPLEVELAGPQDTINEVLDPGDHAFTDLPSGSYCLTVYDQQIGSVCPEIINLDIDDNTPDPFAVGDNYDTPFNTPASANVLDNDTGLALELSDVFAVFGGMVEFQSNGDFTFTPDDGFIGQASFEYTVTDACGNTATGSVVIEVMPGECNFTVQFDVTDANCGLSDGMATVNVNEPGNYQYTWSDGTAGQTISNVPTGTYDVTIADLDLGCDLTFSVDIGENPADYISNVEVTQPTCTTPGEISFTASTPGAGPLNMLVTHPGGFDAFAIGTGIVNVSDFVPIVDGDYTIVVIDDSAGSDCTDQFMVTITTTGGIVISLNMVIPPSGPTAMDGVIVIDVDVPGTEPYTVLLDGVPVFDAGGAQIFIEGFAAGDYTVQLVDANGCESNILLVTVPPSGVSLTAGFGLTILPDTFRPYEQPNYDTQPLVAAVFSAGLRYPALGHMHEFSTSLITDGTRLLTRVEHLTDVKALSAGSIHLIAQLGLSSDIIDGRADQCWVLQGKVNKRLKGVLEVEGRVGVRGWKGVKEPAVSVGVRLTSGDIIRN